MKPLALVLLAVALLAPLPGCPSSGGESPEEVIEGFLASLNTRDWEGVTSRLSPESMALLPETEEERIYLKHEILETAHGRLSWDVSEHRITETGEARVPVTLRVRVAFGGMTAPVQRAVTFGLKREEGVWKVLPAVTLASGRVVENPLDLLRLAGRIGTEPEKPPEPGSTPPGEAEPR